MTQVYTISDKYIYEKALVTLPLLKYLQLNILILKEAVHSIQICLIIEN